MVTGENTKGFRQTSQINLLNIGTLALVKFCALWGRIVVFEHVIRLSTASGYCYLGMVLSNRKKDVLALLIKQRPDFSHPLYQTSYGFSILEGPGANFKAFRSSAL